MGTKSEETTPLLQVSNFIAQDYLTDPYCYQCETLIFSNGQAPQD